MKLNLFVILFTIVLIGCGVAAGTLGGFDRITFPTSKRALVVAIDSLYAQHPEYKIPDKWKREDDWKSRGYDFLDSRIFYFMKQPEEMYYVSFYGDANDSVQVDSTATAIAIRAVYNGSTYNWTKEGDLNSSEEKRMQKRFKEEIISKLEKYTNTKSTHE